MINNIFMTRNRAKWRGSEAQATPKERQSLAEQVIPPYEDKYL
jgi:hypothetical protein